MSVYSISSINVKDWDAYAEYMKLVPAVIKKYGGKYWRADSIQGFDDALRYGKFLQKRFNGTLQISVRGKIE